MMTTEELLALHEATSNRCRDIMRRKNNDYTGGQATDDPFANFNMSSAFGVHPALGVVLRIGDKLQRIRSFANDGALQVSGETIDDACEDIVNYAIIIKGIFRAEAAQRSTVAAAGAPADRCPECGEPLSLNWHKGKIDPYCIEHGSVGGDSTSAYAASLDAPDYEPDDYGHHAAVAPTEPPAPPYRMLEIGEVIQEGDEFLLEDGRWLLTECEGFKVESCDSPYRRLEHV